MTLWELFNLDLGDRGAESRLKQCIQNYLARTTTQLEQVETITPEIVRGIMREAYMLPPFDTIHCFEEYNQRVLRDDNFENPTRIVLVLLRNLNVS